MGQSNSNKNVNCDCLRSNPILTKSDKCKIGLNQEKFNSDDDERSKRSIDDDTDPSIDWSLSSSAKTLENLNVNSLLKKKEIERKVFLKFLPIKK